MHVACDSQVANKFRYPKSLFIKVNIFKKGLLFKWNYIQAPLIKFIFTVSKGDGFSFTTAIVQVPYTV